MTPDEPGEDDAVSVESEPAVLRVRHSRTPGGAALALGSVIVGVAGLFPAPRSGAVESSFPTTIAAIWYAVMLAGSLLLVFALSSPGWRDDEQRVQFGPPWLRAVLAPLSVPWATHVTPDNYRRIIGRLYADQAGNILCGWQWTSYGLAALAYQGARGFTAFILGGVIVGIQTAIRLRQLHLDTRDLRAWRERGQAHDEEG